MNQVHKENLTHVENANPGRQGLELEIFGMEGVPAEIIDQHNQQVTQAHFAEEQERARLTGNPMRGAYVNGQAAPNKRPKINESLEEIEERAAKFREDRKNGVLPAPVEPVQNPVRTPGQSKKREMANRPLDTARCSTAVRRASRRTRCFPARHTCISTSRHSATLLTRKRRYTRTTW